MTNQDTKLDLAKIRSRLSAAKGKEYWRSLDELAETDDFNELLFRVFPRQASAWLDTFSRRDFPNLIAASLSLAGLSAHVQPPSQ